MLNSKILKEIFNILGDFSACSGFLCAAASPFILCPKAIGSYQRTMLNGAPHAGGHHRVAVHNLAFLGCGFSGMCRHLENVLVANSTVVEIKILKLKLFFFKNSVFRETQMLFSHCVCALQRVFDK